VIETPPSRLQFRNLKRLLSRNDEPAIIADLLGQANPKADLSERILWLESLLRWLKRSQNDPSGSADARIRYLLQRLEQNPKWKSQVAQTLRSLLRDCSTLRLFLQTGTAIENGLLAELVDRMLARILPEAPEKDFLEIISRALGAGGDAEWIRNLSVEALKSFIELIEFESEGVIWANVRQSIQEAILIFSANVTHYGLSSEVRRRHSILSITASPFLGLQILLNRLSIKEFSTIAESRKEIDATLSLCRQAIQAVFRNMESSGVSVGLVYRLEILSSSLDRIDDLLGLLEISDSEKRREHAKLLFAKLVRAAGGRRSIRGHLRAHLDLLSRKIAERNGYSGEHYISRSGSESRKLFVSAMGGGVIVVFMTICKLYLHRMDLPPLLFAFGAWGVYAAGFLSMQFLGCTLATKLPSFTASHLAHKLRDIKDRDKTFDFANELLDTVRSQSIALLGNVVGVLPVILVLGFSLKALWGVTIIPRVEAFHSLGDVDPVFSLALPLAALTGIELWLSSLAGGWFENWIVFRRVPEAIAEHPRMKRILGASTARQIADWLLHNSSGIAGNVALGFLFGFVPFLGAVLGLNFDGRHVTISTTSAAIDLISTDPASLTWRIWVMTVIGLLLIGVMNFLVSFSFALFIAARAGNVKPAWLRYVIGVSIRTYFSRR
jgi:site-specific recombinase